MRLNRLMLVIVWLCNTVVASAQNQIRDTIVLEDIKLLNETDDISKFNPVVVPEYFLLGTLSDYTGRFAYIDRDKQIDRYYPYEKPIVEYLTKYIKKEFNISVDTSFAKSGHIKMYSDTLSKMLNSYYGSNDEIIDSLLKTDKQLYSFILGNYYRYGQKLSDTIYKIQTVNSPKDKLLYRSLKRIDCEKLLCKFFNAYPSSDIFYFEITPKLKKYFDLIEPGKAKLEESFKNIYVIKYACKTIECQNRYFQQVEEKMKREIKKVRDFFQD